MVSKVKSDTGKWVLAASNAHSYTGMAKILRKTGVASNSTWSSCSPARSNHTKKLTIAATYLSGSGERDEISTTRGATTTTTILLKGREIH